MADKAELIETDFEKENYYGCSVSEFYDYRGNKTIIKECKLNPYSNFTTKTESVKFSKDGTVIDYYKQPENSKAHTHSHRH